MRMAYYILGGLLSLGSIPYVIFAAEISFNSFPGHQLFNIIMAIIVFIIINLLILILTFNYANREKNIKKF